MIPNKDTPFYITDKDDRLTTFPIQHEDLFNMYKKAYQCFWTVEEIDMSKDRNDFETKLTPGEQRFVKYVLAFFAASDGIVNLNIVERFKKDVPMLEAQYFYDFQVAVENIHAQTYSLLLDTIVEDPDEKEYLLNAAKTMPVIETMSNYMFKCIASDEGFATRILRMACVEGLFFSGCFAAIFWLASRGLMPGFTFSNELISRDEGLHCDQAILLYKKILETYKLSEKEIHTIIHEAVDISKEFINDALPSNLEEMNADLMSLYIEEQADNILVMIGVNRYYGSKHQFSFMDQLNMVNRSNFFERRVSEYAKTAKSMDEDAVDMDF